MYRQSPMSELQIPTYLSTSLSFLIALSNGDCLAELIGSSERKEVQDGGGNRRQ